jgi:hypothetical protein
MFLALVIYTNNTAFYQSVCPVDSIGCADIEHRIVYVWEDGRPRHEKAVEFHELLHIYYGQSCHSKEMLALDNAFAESIGVIDRRCMPEMGDCLMC